MISVIICSVDPTKFTKITKNYKELMGEEPHEIIGIHDAISLCEGYNRGIQHAAGDILVFSHDDIEILSSDFVRKLKFHLTNFEIVGVAGTDVVVEGAWTRASAPYLHGQVAHPGKDEYLVMFFDYGVAASQGRTASGNMKMLDGLFFAVNRTVLDKVSFDQANFDGFHCYDADFTYSAFLAGCKLAVCNDIAVVHDSAANFSSNEAFQKYNRTFIGKHAKTLDRVALGVKHKDPVFAWDSCPTKGGVLHTFAQPVQANVYQQFSARFPEMFAAARPVRPTVKWVTEVLRRTLQRKLLALRYRSKLL